MKTKVKKKNAEAEILKGNKLVAKFMSEKIDLKQWGPNWQRILKLYVSSEVPNYNTSWDWLMPVVARIKQLHKEGKFSRAATSRYTPQDKIFCLHIINSPIEEVWQDTVNFIKWYIKQTKQTK